MAQRADLRKAAGDIRAALEKFVNAEERGNIHVFESSAGSLRVFIGSDKFKGVGLTDRQKRVWSHLDQHVDSVVLRSCSGVHPMDIDEYDRSSFSEAHDPESVVGGMKPLDGNHGPRQI